MSFSDFGGFLIFLLVIASGFNPSMDVVDVGETSSTDDYYDRTHRQSFSHQGVHFVFYIDDSYQLVYSGYKRGKLVNSSVVAGEVWSFADFSLTKKGDYVYLVYAMPEGIGYRLHFVRGELESGRINWEERWALERGDRPFIDLHNGTPVVVYSSRRDKSFKWIHSNDASGESWSEPESLLTWKSNDKDFFPAVYSLGENGLMFIYWHGGSDRIYAIRFYNGSYSNPHLLYNCFDYSMEYQFFYYCWDAIVLDEELVYFLNPAGEVLSWSTEGEGWKLDKRLMSESRESSMGLSVDEKLNEIYMFSLFKETGSFGYYHRNATGWSDFVNLTEIADYKISGNCNRELLNGSTGIRWFEEIHESMKIKYSIINLKKPAINTPVNDKSDGKNNPHLYYIIIGGIVLGILLFSIKRRLS